MGRQQYLTRLALGRSAYQDVVPEDVHQNEATHNEEDEASASASVTSNEDGGSPAQHSIYVQQHDEKGRPINPATEARNAAVRRAQNDIYALVGVVEKKNNEDAHRQQEHVSKKEDRAAVLTRENDSVDVLEFLTRLLVIPPQCWLRSLLFRILVGSYDYETNFLAILQKHSTRSSPGWRGFYSLIFPGAAAHCLYILLLEVLSAGTEEVVSRLQTAVLRSDLPRSKIRNMHSQLKVISRVLTNIIVVGLLPLKEWYFLQELGLVSPFIWLPPLAAFFPGRTSPASFHRHLWQSPSPRFPVLGAIGSTACLILLRELLWDKFEADEDTPLFSTTTDFRSPKVDDAQSQHTLLKIFGAQSRTFWEDPFGCILQPIAIARQRLLLRLGWTLRTNTTDLLLPDMENNVELATDPKDDEAPGSSAEAFGRPELTAAEKVRVYRSTALAHFPAEILARMTNRLLCRTIMIPLESLMLRSIVRTWLCAVQDPRSMGVFTTLSNGRRFYPPYRGSLLGVLFAKGDGKPTPMVAASYLSKVGLALAMDATLIIGTFSISSWMTSWLGQNAFRWGSISF